MPISCNHSIKDSIKLLDNLIRDKNTAYKTVASYQTQYPENFDFPDLVTALEWVKEIGSATNQPTGIVLELDTGTHYWKRTDFLRQGIIDEHHDEAISYFHGINLELVGQGITNTVIEIDSNFDDIYFVNSILKMSKFEIKILGLGTNNIINIKMYTSIGFIESSLYSDIGFLLNNDSSIFVSNGVSFANNNNINKTALVANTNSFIRIEGTDFTDADYNIEAKGFSTIYLYNCTNTTFLTYYPDMNTYSLDMSFIYDGTVYMQQVQSDWAVTDPSAVNFIRNKPDIATGSSYETGLDEYEPDLREYNFFEFRLDRDAEILSPLNADSGREGTIVISMDSVGGHTLSYGANWLFPGGIPEIENDPDAKNIFKYTAIDNTHVLLEYVADFV